MDFKWPKRFTRSPDILTVLIVQVLFKYNYFVYLH